MRATQIVAADRLTHRFGTVVALDGVDLEVGPGITGLLGANGAGKTTLLTLVLGLRSPTSGGLRVLGEEPARSGPQLRARIGYAPEGPALSEDVPAQELVRHVGELHGLPRRIAVTRAADTLHLLGLGEERLRPVGTMSLGQRQRVKLAQAVVHDPALVLLDEPTDGLDPAQREHMLATVRRIGGELGIHVILSSHVLAEIEAVCDRVVVLDAGRVTAHGAVTEITSRGVRRVRVELEPDAGAVAGALRTRGVAVEEVEASATSVVLLVDVHGHQTLDVVRDTLADLGAGLRRLAPERVSLEERFFSPASP